MKKLICYFFGHILISVKTKNSFFDYESRTTIHTKSQWLECDRCKKRLTKGTIQVIDYANL